MLTNGTYCFSNLLENAELIFSSNDIFILLKTVHITNHTLQLKFVSFV